MCSVVIQSALFVMRSLHINSHVLYVVIFIVTFIFSHCHYVPFLLIPGVTIAELPLRRFIPMLYSHVFISYSFSGVTIAERPLRSIPVTDHPVFST
jgi:hypothetical protein